MYELFDKKTGNMVAFFDTRADALAHVERFAPGRDVSEFLLGIEAVDGSFVVQPLAPFAPSPAEPVSVTAASADGPTLYISAPPVYPVSWMVEGAIDMIGRSSAKARVSIRPSERTGMTYSPTTA